VIGSRRIGWAGYVAHAAGEVYIEIGRETCSKEATWKVWYFHRRIILE
jgi:hypothetical protein